MRVATSVQVVVWVELNRRMIHRRPLITSVGNPWRALNMPKNWHRTDPRIEMEEEPMCFGRSSDWVEIDIMLRFALSFGLFRYSLILPF